MKPIIFSSEMVKAILDGRKTQTRSPVKSQPSTNFDYCRVVQVGKWFHIEADKPETVMHTVVCPYAIGDRLWVRETFAVESNCGIAGSEEYPPPFKDNRPIQWHDDLEYGKFWDQCHYKATDPLPELCYTDRDEPGVRWKPSIHMPRWASRITLEIVNVKAERLQEITRSDIRAEGLVVPKEYCSDDIEYNYRQWLGDEFKRLWDSLYTKKLEYQWQANPWVWVISFKVINDHLR